MKPEPRAEHCTYRGMRRDRCEKCGQWDSEHVFWEDEVPTDRGMRHDTKMAAEYLAEANELVRRLGR